MPQPNDIDRLLEQAWAYRREGNFKAARDLVENAHKLCKDTDFEYIARIFHIYAQFESDLENYPSALELNQKSLSFYEQIDNPDKKSHSMRHIADIHRRLGNYGESEKSYQQALTIFREYSRARQSDLANMLRGLALVSENLGKTAQAIEAWQEAQSIYQQLGLQNGVDEAAKKIAQLKPLL